MNSKGHLALSIIKSALRVLVCISALLTKNALILAPGLLIAELLGVAEELVDQR